MPRSLFTLLISLLALTTLHASDYPLSKIRQAIAEKKAGWSAEENKFTSMSAEERRRYTGALPINAGDVSPHQLLSIPTTASLPDSLDWRDRDGNWVTPVKDQGQCGSCWAFSAVGQVEAWWKIYNNNPDFKIDLSEQFLLACSDAGNCEQGGRVDESLEFIKNNGIAYESDLPYAALSNIPCSQTSVGWEEHAVYIPDWGYVTLDEAHVENIKNAVLLHPLSVSFEVFDDFYSYKKGVYEHVHGESSGWHAVLITGWNDREKSWIVKNSWGDSWGDNGYFRIKWSDSNMGRYSPFIWQNPATAFLAASVQNLDLDLTFGDLDTLGFSIRNAGPEDVYYFANETFFDNEQPDWLTLRNSAGYLAVFDSVQIELTVDTRSLDPGMYALEIEIITSNSTTPRLVVPVTLTVSKPQFDAKLTRIRTPENELALLSWSSFACDIKNIGKLEMRDFDAVCQIQQNEQLILTDTSHIDLLGIGRTETVHFEKIKPRVTGDMICSVQILNAPDDYNDFNNRLSAVQPVTHTVENFESTGDRWLFDGGWAFTSKLNGHTGNSSAHVNGGLFPHPNNMNTQMTYTSGFELDGVDTLFVTYWTRYAMADSNDVCYVETSADSLTWELTDSFTGTHPAWQERVLNLTRYAQEKWAKAWIRFCFVSDESGSSIGALIDDLNVYTETVTTTATDPNTGIHGSADVYPAGYILRQNKPNPFNPGTTIIYSLAAAAHVTMTIYDLQGRIIDLPVNELKPAGQHTVYWHASDRPSGVYFYVLEATSKNGHYFLDRKKMVLIK